MKRLLKMMCYGAERNLTRGRADLLLFASKGRLKEGFSNLVPLTLFSSGRADAFPRDAHSCLVPAMTAAAVRPTSVGHAIHAWPVAENPSLPFFMITSS
jgi:hypothetical protein